MNPSTFLQGPLLATKLFLPTALGVLIPRPWLHALLMPLSTLAIALDTVKSHVSHIFAKLGIDNRMQAVKQAHDLSLLGEGSPNRPSPLSKEIFHYG